MKKFKYIGSAETVLPTLGLVVKPGDVIEAPACFKNALFKEVAPETTKQKRGDK